MTTQKQIKEWIPEALETFQTIMPPISVPSTTITYPEIHIASAATLYKVRAALVEKTQTLNVNIKEPYTSVMETLHGDCGTAILIYQKYCPESQGEFNHMLWHELGHFYAIATEDEPFFYLGGQELLGDDVLQIGYWVWMEFVAECIANHVSSQSNPIDTEKYKCQRYWQKPYNRLQYMLQSAYTIYPGSFMEYDLAFYFATLLTDAAAVVFVDGAKKNELTVWDVRKLDYVPMKPGSIEPTAISFLPAEYKEPLLKIKNLLQSKTKQEEFWKVNVEFLDRLGRLVIDLNQIKAVEFARSFID